MKLAVRVRSEAALMRPATSSPPSRTSGVTRFSLLLSLLATGSPSQAESQSRNWLPAPRLQASIVDQVGTRFGNPQQMIALPGGGFALVDDYVAIQGFDAACPATIKMRTLRQSR